MKEQKEGTFKLREDDKGNYHLYEREPVKVFSSKIEEGERLLAEFRNSRKPIVSA